MMFLQRGQHLKFSQHLAVGTERERLAPESYVNTECFLRLAANRHVTPQKTGRHCFFFLATIIEHRHLDKKSKPIANSSAHSDPDWGICFFVTCICPTERPYSVYTINASRKFFVMLSAWNCVSADARSYWSPVRSLYSTPPPDRSTKPYSSTVRTKEKSSSSKWLEWRMYWRRRYY